MLFITLSFHVSFTEECYLYVCKNRDVNSVPRRVSSTDKYIQTKLNFS